MKAEDKSKLLPWGRFVLAPEHRDPDLQTMLEFFRSQHCIGRVRSKSDLIVDKACISGLHCIVSYKGKDSQGTPIVEVEDKSRYGTYVHRRRLGYKNKATLKSGDVVHFANPDGRVYLAYTFEILPSGLTKENEALHKQLSEDEMSVSARTRKRILEDTQSTQSPSQALSSPPRPRPAKRIRHAPVAGSQSSAANVASPAKSKAAGKKRLRPDVPPEDSVLGMKLKKQFEEERAKLKTAHEEEKKAFKIVMAEQMAEIEALKKEREQQLKDAQEKFAAEKLAAAKKTHDDEIAALKKAHKTKVETLNKAHEMLTETLKKVQAEGEVAREELGRVQRTLDDVLVDGKTPPQVRSVVELQARILELQREIKAKESERLLSRPRTRADTPPSKAAMLQKEALGVNGRRLLELTQEDVQDYEEDLVHDEQERLYKKQQVEKKKKRQEEIRQMQERFVVVQNLSGSSQSQDSIDAGRLRRSSQGSSISNENSEPSPGDIPLTQDPDEETKSGEARTPNFNLYGARSTQPSNLPRPTTTSRPRLFRIPVPSKSAGRPREEDEETKSGNQ